MKKPLIYFLLIFTIYIILSLSFIDKHYFISPVKYQNGLVIRNDSMGAGLFGTKRSGGRKHQGIDLLADIGEPVVAARGGLVVEAKSRKGMGNYIILRHGLSLTTIYGHLNEILVRKNQFVRQGDIIGLVGKTGNANYRNMRAHLHFEIRKFGIPQDPLNYLD